MNNNDILRRSRYILDLKDNQLVKIFKHVDRAVTEQQVNLWLKRDEEPEFVAMGDEDLIDFLDSLIIEKRGKKDGPSVRFKQQLDNNLILMKLKIAFALKAEETLDVMQLAEFKISKHELSALFRKKDHKHYRVCKNQILRKFMKGLQIKHRGISNAIKNTHASQENVKPTASQNDHVPYESSTETRAEPKNDSQTVSEDKPASKLKLNPKAKKAPYVKKDSYTKKEDDNKGSEKWKGSDAKKEVYSPKAPAKSPAAPAKSPAAPAKATPTKTESKAKSVWKMPKKD